MDYSFISNILSLVTIVLIIVGFLLLVFLTLKYEKLAIEQPENKDVYRERRRFILRFYLRVVIIVFIVAVITALIGADKINF